MREALAARSERDFVSAAPTPRRGRVSGTKTNSAWVRVLAAIRRRPGVVVGGLAATAVAAVVALNAVAFQTQRHPAPLFVPKGQPVTMPAVAAMPLPPVRPTAPAVAKPLPANRDPIGEMIRGGEGGAARPVEAKAEPQRAVAAAQRALTKLGYGPLKADGMIGEGTRQAIERFERDRRLPVTRDLSPRTWRELSAQAGVPLE